MEYIGDSIFLVVWVLVVQLLRQQEGSGYVAMIREHSHLFFWSVVSMLLLCSVFLLYLALLLYRDGLTAITTVLAVLPVHNFVLGLLFLTTTLYLLKLQYMAIRTRVG